MTLAFALAAEHVIVTNEVLKPAFDTACADIDYRNVAAAAGRLDEGGTANVVRA
jgi:hypothetical protein